MRQEVSPAQRDALDGFRRDPISTAPWFDATTNTLEVSPWNLSRFQLKQNRQCRSLSQDLSRSSRLPFSRPSQVVSFDANRVNHSSNSIGRSRKPSQR